MLTDVEQAALEAAWQPARKAGVLGQATVEELYEHTAGFVSAVCSAFDTPPNDLQMRIVDVGTGAGVPAVLLAHALPSCSVVAVDSSEQRLDHVRRAVRALDLGSRVDVVHGRADELGRTVMHREQYDIAVARLLAEPGDSVELLAPLVRPGGVLVVSARGSAQPQWDQLPVAGLPLGPARWSADRRIDEASARSEHSGGVSQFVTIERIGECPTTLPRRPNARKRQPFLAET